MHWEVEDAEAARLEIVVQEDTVVNHEVGLVKLTTMFDSVEVPGFVTVTVAVV